MPSETWSLRCPSCGGRVPWTSGEDALRCLSCGTRFASEGGIVAMAPPRDDEDYPEALIDVVSAAEAAHFWFRARSRVIVSTIRRAVGPLRGVRVLDLGCGTGVVTAALERAGALVCGVDMQRRALERARARVRGPLVWTAATAPPAADPVDVVTLFDVIEHLADDAGALREAGEALRPGGHVVVTVPAGPDLWTPYDEVIGHKRRYRRADLAAVLARSGLDVRHVSYFNIVSLIVQKMQRRFAASAWQSAGDPIAIVKQALRVPPAGVNALLDLSVRMEAPLRRLPWVRGGSLIAVARRGSAPVPPPF